MNPLMEKIEKICKDEDIIILFDSEEIMDWGIPEVHKDGIFLTAENGDTIDGHKTWFYKWEDISIIAHYGFQVKKIKDELRDFRKIKVFQLNGRKIKPHESGEVEKYEYVGDPLEICGKFSLLWNGLYVQQEYGAEAVIMPQTEILIEG